MSLERCHRDLLVDLAFELAQKAAGLRRSLPASMVDSLAALVRAMNCYYTRRAVSALLDAGVLTSESTRAPLRLAFPATLAGRWLPGLFPDQAA